MCFRQTCSSEESKEGSSSGIFNVGKGRDNNRNSGLRGSSSSIDWKNVKSRNCSEKGHVKSEFPCSKEKYEMAVNNVQANEDSKEDALVCSVKSTDSWVMDCGSPFHATHS